MKEKNAMLIILLFGLIFSLFGVLTGIKNPLFSINSFIVNIFINLSGSSLLIYIVYRIYIFTGENPILDSLKKFRKENVSMMNLILASDTARQTYCETGVSQIIPQRGDVARNMWNDFIAQDNEKPLKVEVLGKVLNRIQESFITTNERDIIVEKIKNGTRMYILLIEPGSKPAAIKAQDEGDDTEHSTVGYRKSRNSPFIEAIKEVINRTENNQKNGCLVVGYYSKTPYCQITRIGDKMLVTNYLTGHSGRQCPSLIIKKEHQHNLFDVYRETFYQLLEDAHIKSKKKTLSPTLYQSGTFKLAI